MYLISDETNGSITEFKISDKAFAETNIQDTYIGGVQLIEYNSAEDERHASNWKAEKSTLINRQLPLIANEVSLFMVGLISLVFGGILMGVGMYQAGSYALIGAVCFIGLTELLAYVRKHQSNTERRTKRIEESEEKLIKHFSLLTTGSFKEIYENYGYTPIASHSKIEALVRAHLLMPSEAVVLNKLFEVHFDPEAATEEERTQLEVAQASFSLLQAELTIAKLNKVPIFEHTSDTPHTDSSDWPLYL